MDGRADLRPGIILTCIASLLPASRFPLRVSYIQLLWTIIVHAYVVVKAKIKVKTNSAGLEQSACGDRKAMVENKRKKRGQVLPGPLPWWPLPALVLQASRQMGFG